MSQSNQTAIVSADEREGQHAVGVGATPTGEQVGARNLYPQIQNILKQIAPHALSIDDLVSLMETDVSHQDVYEATNYGIEQGEVARDLSFTPPKFRWVNESERKKTGNRHEEEKRKYDEEKRKRGARKAALELLMETGEHLTVEEIYKRIGGITTQESLSSNLSNAWANNLVAREPGSIPYRYYISESKRRKFLPQFKMPTEAELTGTPETAEMIEEQVRREVALREEKLREQQKEMAQQQTQMQQSMQQQIEELRAQLLESRRQQSESRPAAASPVSAAAPAPEAQAAPPADTLSTIWNPQAALDTDMASARPALSVPSPLAAAANTVQAFLDLDDRLVLSIDGRTLTVPAAQTRKIACLLAPLLTDGAESGGENGQ